MSSASSRTKLKMPSRLAITLRPMVLQRRMPQFHLLKERKGGLSPNVPRGLVVLKERSLRARSPSPSSSSPIFLGITMTLNLRASSAPILSSQRALSAIAMATQEEARVTVSLMSEKNTWNKL